MKTSILISAALGLAAVGAFGQDNLDAWNGKKLPAFKATTMAGAPLSNKSLKGKVVLMDFWATWCGPCKAGMPMMQRLHSAYQRKGLMVVGADVWERPNAGKAPAQYPKSNKLTYTFTKGNEALAKVLGLQNIPVVMLLDKSGTIRHVIVGFDSSGKEEATLNTKIKQLLASK